MEMLTDLVRSVSGWLRHHLPSVCAAIAATLLAIYGMDIGRLIKRRIKDWAFLTRLGVFVLLCAFGYGAASFLCTRLLSELLGHVDNVLLAPLVIVMFLLLLLGLLAETKKQI